MDSSLKSMSPLSHSFILLFASFAILVPSVKPALSNLVFEKCANQTFPASVSHQSHSQMLSSILQQLSAASSRSNFFKTVAGNQELGISALFQCRGDLDHEQCHDCVSSVPDHISNTLCNQAMAARIQLDGCYFRYETDGFTDNGVGNYKHELLHETCSEEKAGGIGFEEARDAAFGAMENGVMGGNGFLEWDYEKVHVMGGCDGDVVGCECGECVSNAVGIAEEKCGSSVSGEVYLEGCFVRYTYYPGPEEGGGGTDVTAKTAAIVVGVAAALGAAFMFFKLGFGRKKDG